MLRLVAAATLVACAVGQGADMLDLSDTSVALAEKTREVTSVSPQYGSSNGGTRVHGNSVRIGETTCPVVVASL